jgi:hypothetical protein
VGTFGPVNDGDPMPFKSKAQRRKFAELLVRGEISPETYEEWNRCTGKRQLPERVKRAKRGKKRKAPAKSRKKAGGRSKGAARSNRKRKGSR